MTQEARLAVVIPSYKVSRFIEGVIGSIGPEVSLIYVVDDCCPEKTGQLVEEKVKDHRVRVVYHEQNQGVGGAVMSGYRRALADGADVIVKLDGDGQMDAALIKQFVAPIVNGQADYTKGNRFFDLTNIHRMPKMRLFGNAGLSFMAKLSTGYWDVFDPTNGYTAIHATAARRLPMDKISKRYFFETDMLFRLGILRAVVVDVPMDAVYGDEVSNLKISKVLGEFAAKHARNFLKRIFYNYFLRDMSIASLELVIGLCLFLFGGLYGAYHWIHSASIGVVTPAGTVMAAALPLLAGLQLLLNFFSYDIANVPRPPVHRFAVMRPETAPVNAPGEPR
ncbi:glycosyltransferase family 2 protein [Paraburkholderia flava]|uniref:glycosyltransferase family 2 protein n=1 Tax=Paraburkholderia flava TaxID=2547393 RepID=UPI00105E3AF7|nr:glycosyltransferase family 2 protein [Paraburkholderia flava]